MRAAAAFAALAALAPSRAAAELPTGAALDALFPRAAPGQLEREAELSAGSAPVIPFQPFSEEYLDKALATPTNWTAKGAVTPVKNQGPHVRHPSAPPRAPLRLPLTGRCLLLRRATAAPSAASAARKASGRSSRVSG